MTTPSSRILSRSSDKALPLLSRADGCFLYDANGARYLDACSSVGVSVTGHNDPRVVGAIQAQMKKIDFAHGAFFSSRPAEELAELLCTQAPRGLEKAFFVSSGSEAVEAALKLARQYFHEAGERGRQYVISRRQSYHGNTLGALSVSGHKARRQLYEPMLAESHQVSPCYSYRDRWPDEDDAEYVQRLADELDEKIVALGPDRVMAFLAETVAGATLGAVPPVPGYFARIKETCDRHGVLLILDEVLCGVGRCSSYYACQQDNVVPDMVALAKGLGGGYFPIGALMISGRVAERISVGSGYFRHGHTFGGHPLACTGALEVQRIILEQDLVARANRMGVLLRRLLSERFSQHPHVGDLRGRGLLLGIEIVADRDTKETFDPRHDLAQHLKQEAMANGILVYPASGTADGYRGDHILLAPPYTITEPEIEFLADALAKTLGSALRKLPASAGADGT